MNKISAMLLIAALCIFACFSGATAQDQAADKIFRSLSPEEAMRMVQGRDDVIFLDVRTPQERAQGYIPGSQLVSFNDLALGRISFPKDKPILLVCAVGGRSYVAAQILSQRGYKEVYSLSGGVNNWYKAGLPLVIDNPK